MRYFLFPSYSVNGMLCAGSVILLTACYTPVVCGMLYALCPVGMLCAHLFVFLVDVFPTGRPMVDVFPTGRPMGMLCARQFLFLVDVFPTGRPLQKLSLLAHMTSDVSLPYCNGGPSPVPRPKVLPEGRPILHSYNYTLTINNNYRTDHYYSRFT